MTSRIAPALRSLRRAVTLHRRLLAAGCTAAAVAIGLGVVSPPPPPTRPVVVAATDLHGGGVLTHTDLDLLRLPPEAIPAGAAARPARVVGRTLAAPVRDGEPLTDVRVLGPSLVQAYGPGLVAAPVRIADADSVALVRVGDRVDILAPDPSSQLPTSVAVADAPVVAVPRPQEEVASTAGALIVVAVSTDEALQLAQHSVLGPLVLTLRE
ncbi:MAG: SAF domain-containing protein [Nocardioidaceae bacterium]